MDKEIANIQLNELCSVYNTIGSLYQDKELSKKMYELEHDEKNLMYIQGYLDALNDLEKCITPDIDALSEIVYNENS